MTSLNPYCDLCGIPRKRLWICRWAKHIKVELRKGKLVISPAQMCTSCTISIGKLLPDGFSLQIQRISSLWKNRKTVKQLVEEFKTGEEDGQR